MTSRSTNLLGVLAALMVGGTVASVGCSGTTDNRPTGGTGGSGNSGGSAQGGSGNGSQGGNGGEIFIPSAGAGMNDGGLDPETACAAQSAAATLGKKPVDIIIVIDNSGSMGNEIEAVQKNINVNFAQIIEQSGIDYRVILIADHGRFDPDESVCIEAPLSGIPAGGCASPPAAPVNNPPKFYHYNRPIESTDSWCKLLRYYNMADNTPSTSVGWKEWLRPDSFKTFIEITDDRVACSEGGFSFNDNDTVTGGQTSATNFDNALTTLDPVQFGTPQARNYAWYSIIGLATKMPATDPHLPADPILTPICTGAQQSGTGYQALSIMTNSLRFPLCQTASYDVVFQAIAQGVIAGSKVACDFPIPAAPMGQTVDLNTVQVQYTAMGMGAPKTLTKVADASACAPDSFYLDVAAKQVYLCPDTCTVVQADDAAKIDVLFACEIGGAN
jgi:hypothetical protein